MERGVRAALLQGKSALDGTLFLTNIRLLFEAKKGDARWMSVPFDEIRSAGLYPWPRATMGAPRSRQQCLCIETTIGEQVWWDFEAKAEREWLPLVQQKAAAARAVQESEST